MPDKTEASRSSFATLTANKRTPTPCARRTRLQAQPGGKALFAATRLEYAQHALTVSLPLQRALVVQSRLHVLVCSLELLRQSRCRRQRT